MLYTLLLDAYKLCAINRFSMCIPRFVFFSKNDYSMILSKKGETIQKI